MRGEAGVTEGAATCDEDAARNEPGSCTSLQRALGRASQGRPWHPLRGHQRQALQTHLDVVKGIADAIERLPKVVVEPVLRLGAHPGAASTHAPFDSCDATLLALPLAPATPLPNPATFPTPPTPCPLQPPCPHLLPASAPMPIHPLPRSSPPAHTPGKVGKGWDRDPYHLMWSNGGT